MYYITIVTGVQAYLYGYVHACHLLYYYYVKVKLINKAGAIYIIYRVYYYNHIQLATGWEQSCFSHYQYKRKKWSGNKNTVIVIFSQGVHSVKLIFSGALHIHTNIHIIDAKVITMQLLILHKIYSQLHKTQLANYIHKI